MVQYSKNRNESDRNVPIPLLPSLSANFQFSEFLSPTPFFNYQSIYLIFKLAFFGSWIMWSKQVTLLLLTWSVNSIIVVRLECQVVLSICVICTSCPLPEAKSWLKRMGHLLVEQLFYLSKISHLNQLVPLRQLGSFKELWIDQRQLVHCDWDTIVGSMVQNIM